MIPLEAECAQMLYLHHPQLPPLLWFILGNYWVFSVYLPDFIPPFQQPQDYREKTLYLFAVGVLVLSHSVLLLLVPCSGCVYVWSRRRSAVDEDRTTTSSTHAHAHAHRYTHTDTHGHMHAHAHRYACT